MPPYNSLKHFFFSFKGRISRRYLLLGIFFPMTYLLLTALSFYIFFSNPQLLGGASPADYIAPFLDWLKTKSPLALFVSIIVLYLYFYLPVISTTKRLHDLNQSGWRQLPLYLPTFISILFIASSQFGIIEDIKPLMTRFALLTTVLWGIALVYGIYLYFKLIVLRGNPEDNQYGKARPQP